jgi:arsenate reductase
MKLRQDELWLLFDCNSTEQKKTRAFARSVSNHVNEFSFNDMNITKIMWADILKMLNLRAKDLLNKADPKYQSELAGHSFHDEDWLNILMKNPCLIKAPIAIMNSRAVLCIKPKDIFKLTEEHHIEHKF